MTEKGDLTDVASSSDIATLIDNAESNSYSDPLFLSNADNPGQQLITFQYNGQNYPNWSVGNYTMLISENELGFITGGCVKPSEDWIMCVSSSKQLWNKVVQRYGQTNGPLIHRLTSDFALLFQGSSNFATADFAAELITSSINGDSAVTWIVDSGASDHMTFDASLFIDLKPLASPKLIDLPDNSRMYATQTGSIKLNSFLTLKDVLLVPGFARHLLSVGSLTDQSNLEVNFTSSNCSFKDRSTGQVVATGERFKGVYMISPTADSFSDYPPYPQSSDHVTNPAPTAPNFPNFHSSNSLHYPYDQKQPGYDQHQSAVSDAPPNPSSNPNLDPPYGGTPYSYGNTGASSAPGYQYSYSNELDRWGNKFEEQGMHHPEYNQEGFGYDGVYRYGGGKVEPYGTRGTAGLEVIFDDYGRAVGMSNGKDHGGSGLGSEAPPKVARAIPKAEAEDDAWSGVKKFRVKVLAEGYGQTDMDVVCQIGLDGIRMLDPATSRTLRIYPLETVTRMEVLDSCIYAFWAKTSVDIEPKCIRLKSNSYTTNTILDIVTAASIQLKEIGERNDSSSMKPSELQAERKKGFPDWVYRIKPANEEKDHWVPDEAVKQCISCGENFSAFFRRHHCRSCGYIFCDKCTQGRIPLTSDEEAQPVRVCDRCMGEVTQRLANGRDAAGRSGQLRSHEELAKKLKEEMNRKMRLSSGSGSQTQMKEVECPTCTVLLKVEVPTSGSAEIECCVCQHPFLVKAY